MLKNCKHLLFSMKTLLIISLTVFLSCNNADQTKPVADSVTAENKSTNNSKDTVTNSLINDSVILIKFPADSISTTVNAKMRGINHPITVLIPVKQGKQLTASITTEDSLANIRINQIFMPDGKADGPFGKTLERAIHQQGMYKLILAENMMQGDEWKGSFKLTIKVK